MFYKISLTTTLLVSSFLTNSVCSGFKRTALDVSPLSTAYTSQAGILNLTKSQITPELPVNSYWTIYFLHGSNNHDYFLVAHFTANGTASPISTRYRVSLLDINDCYYYGTTLDAPNATFATDTFYYKADKFETYSTMPDLFSTQVVRSTVEGAEFNLISSPRGPNLYDAGNGGFFWGTDWTYEFAYPEQWVIGNLTYKGEVVDIIPEKSMSWFDRQYGLGVGFAGWNLWILLFENGIKTCIWHSEAVHDYPKQYFATFMFPDGHHEVYPVDSDIHPSVPFVSNQTGFTYYGRHEVTIPGINAYFDIQQPVLAGEMTQEDRPIAATTLYEGYSVVKGYIRGQRVEGWGVSERRYPVL
ncbi:hypothetical protein DL98DRAFT_577626 [Cadophora sp. DSE1049]|nr:hypothetical protein DL98DRAFT_577626 [Cadophora sp. DSE1049]